MDEIDVNIKKYLDWNENLPKAPESAVNRAKALVGSKGATLSCPHCHKSITPYKSPLSQQKILGWVWLGLALTGFGASFIFKAYFFQCLVVALIFAFKFIIDRKQTKTQILVYKTLSEEVAPRRHLDLHKEESRL